MAIVAKLPIITAELETLAQRRVRELCNVHDADGVAAFNQDASQIMYATAALIAHVCGRERLSAIIRAIDTAIPKGPAA